MCVVAVKICIACKYVSSKVRLLLAWSLRDLIKEVDKKTPIFLHNWDFKKAFAGHIGLFFNLKCEHTFLSVTLIQGNIWIALLINLRLYFFSSSLALMFLLFLIRLNVLIAVWNLDFLLLLTFSPPHCSTNNRHHLGNLGWWCCNLSFLTHILA